MSTATAQLVLCHRPSNARDWFNINTPSALCQRFDQQPPAAHIQITDMEGVDIMLCTDNDNCRDMGLRIFATGSEAGGAAVKLDVSDEPESVVERACCLLS